LSETMVHAALYNSINYAAAMLVHSPQPHSLIEHQPDLMAPTTYRTQYNRTKNKIRKIRCTKYQTQTKLQVTGQQQYKQQEKEKYGFRSNSAHNITTVVNRSRETRARKYNKGNPLHIAQ